MTESTKRIALVTGANKGIGLATSRALAQAGIEVLMGVRDEERGRNAAETLVGEGRVARTITLDVTDQDSIDAAVAEVERDFGCLDILINNAGIGLALGGPSTLTVGEIRATLETNFFGALAVTRSFMPLISRASSGRIVNVSCQLGSLFHTSDSQWPGHAFPHAAYSMSKAALNMLTIQFANELSGTSVKINSVDPGYTRTDLTRNQGSAPPEDSARILLYYATLPDDGPTGGFFNESGRMPW